MNRLDQVPMQRLGVPANENGNINIKQSHQIQAQRNFEPIKPMRQHQIDEVSI